MLNVVFLSFQGLIIVSLGFTEGDLAMTHIDL